jgi:nudix-type nucleoside diphosphatase (YffH/AdpP family)
MEKENSIEVKKEEIVYQDFLTIRKRDLIAPNGNEFDRESLMRSEATAVLVYNEDTKKLIFTSQYRDAISGMSLEIPAGMMDDTDTDPKECAVREVLEETGYKVNVLDIIFLMKIQPAPGYTNELINIYLAVVTNEQKVNEGGGLEEENEYIEVVELDVNEAFEKIQSGRLMDAKSIIALQNFKMKNIH